MIRELIRLGIITSVDNSSGMLRAQVKVLSSEADSVEDIILIPLYGMNGNPPIINSRCLIFNIFGHSESKFGLALAPNDVPTTQAGEAVFYNHFGSKIFLKANGDIELTPKEGTNIILNTTGNVNVNAENANITATNTTINGDVEINGDLQVSGNSNLVGSGTSIAGKVFLTHLHSGVTSGINNTGGVV